MTEGNLYVGVQLRRHIFVDKAQYFVWTDSVPTEHGYRITRAYETKNGEDLSIATPWNASEEVFPLDVCQLLQALVDDGYTCTLHLTNTDRNNG